MEPIIWDLPLITGIFLLNGLFVIVALMSVRGQRREDKRNARMKFARDFATLAYEFQARFHKVRNPVIEYYEYYKRPPEAKESEAERERRNELFALRRRIDELMIYLPRLEAMKWEAQVLLDVDSSDNVDELRHLTEDLIAAVERYYSPEFRRMVENKEVSVNIFEEVYDRVFGFSNDEFGQKISQMVDKLSKELIDAIR